MVVGFSFVTSVHNFLQMPDAVVDYNLSNGKWVIVQQQNVLHERTRTLYGATYTASHMDKSQTSKSLGIATEVDCIDGSWNDLSEFYACEQCSVSSKDGVLVPLTIVYSRTRKKESQSPGLLHGHGAYGELLDKRWHSELKSLLDRGWVLAYADVRYVPCGCSVLVILLSVVLSIFFLLSDLVAYIWLLLHTIPLKRSLR